MLIGFGISIVIVGYISYFFGIDDTLLEYILSPLKGVIALIIVYLVVGNIWYYVSVAGLPDKVKEHLGVDMGIKGLRFQLPMFWGGWLFYVSIIVAIIIGIIFPI